MTNADKFKSLFGIYATELWAMPEKNFLKWLNSEVSNSSESPNGWIPCSERLPKYGQPVLTYNLEDDEYEVNHIIDEEDGEWFTDGVDAWMPLPTPYQPKEDES